MGKTSKVNSTQLEVGLLYVSWSPLASLHMHWTVNISAFYGATPRVSRLAAHDIEGKWANCSKEPAPAKESGPRITTQRCCAISSFAAIDPSRFDLVSLR